MKTATVNRPVSLHNVTGTRLVLNVLLSYVCRAILAKRAREQHSTGKSTRQYTLSLKKMNEKNDPKIPPSTFLGNLMKAWVIQV